MKVVGFNWLKRPSKNRKKCKFFCVSNVFRNGMIIMSVLVSLLILGLTNSNFSMNLKSCIENFISSMIMFF